MLARKFSDSEYKGIKNCGRNKSCGRAATKCEDEKKYHTIEQNERNTVSNESYDP